MALTKYDINVKVKKKLKTIANPIPAIRRINLTFIHLVGPNWLSKSKSVFFFRLNFPPY